MTSDYDTSLEVSPHYTDKRFFKPQTIFCSKNGKIKISDFGDPIIEGLNYDYSDRLGEYDRKLNDASRQAASDAGHTLRTARWYEAYLSHFYGHDVELVHILAGVNLGNGHPYLIFGSRKVK